jgi:hypothetical protein
MEHGDFEDTEKKTQPNAGECQCEEEKPEKSNDEKLAEAAREVGTPDSPSDIDPYAQEWNAGDVED